MKTATTTEPRTGHTADSRAGAVVAADRQRGNFHAMKTESKDKADDVANVEKNRISQNHGFASSIRNATDEELNTALAMIQAERTKRQSTKSKAAKRADRKKRARLRKQEKAERKAAAEKARLESWMF